MKPFEDELRRLVKEWLRKAGLDIAVVAHLARDRERFRDTAVFHAQQAVEKFLKALLVRHQIEPPKTHDIERLLRMLREVEPVIAAGLMEATWLTPFGVDIRYPGDFPETLSGDEIRALDLAQRVKDTVMALLEPYLAGS